MKNKSNSKRLFQKAGFFSTAVLFLSMVSFNAFSQTTQPPQGTNPPPSGQPPKTPPETQPSQNNPAHKNMGKDTVKYMKRDTAHAKPDTVRRIPPPHK